MDYFNPPDVAGWGAYYQEPLYYRTWINTANLPVRAEIADRLALVKQNLFGFYLHIDVLKFIETLEDPANPHLLVEEIALIFFPKPLGDQQLNLLKAILLSGLPEEEWTKAYKNLKVNPEDAALAKSMENKLRLLLKKMIGLPEFNLG